MEKVKGHSETVVPHKGGNNPADALAVIAKRQAEGDPDTGGRLCPEERGPRASPGRHATTKETEP